MARRAVNSPALGVMPWAHVVARGEIAVMEW
jgi:hypothetical protein